MRFLAGVDIQANVRQLASRSGDVMAAVAYWGKGAAELTGLAENQRPERIRVICDLLSGACNPAEIEQLQRIGLTVRTLDRLHAKVWIGGNDVIVGSANASHNGLPGDDEAATNASIEAAMLSQDRRLARQLAAWFENQWSASRAIKQRHLDHARDLWSRRHRSGGRGFATPLTEKILDPDSFERFACLRILAYLAADVSPEAVEYVSQNAGRYFTDAEWEDFGDECPWYESPRADSEWAPPTGTVYADFTCTPQGGKFTFKGFWQIRDCPSIELDEIRLTLLTKLPHFNGYSLSPQDQEAIARRIREVVSERKLQMNDGAYIDESFLEFWDTKRHELRQELLAQVVEEARKLCRSGQFSPHLTLQPIQACKEDPAWLAGYARFVGGDIYGNRNPLKRRINPNFGSQIKIGVGAEDRLDDNGTPVREFVKNEIIQSYKLFENHNPQLL